MENNEIIMYKLYVGLNDKDTKKQEIPTKKAIDIICKCLAKQGITGMTEYLGNGVYTHTDGTKTIEKSYIIEMFFVKRTNLKRFAFYHIFYCNSILFYFIFNIYINIQ